MPLYEYVCDACGKRFEVIRKFSDPPLETCALCGKGPVQRQLSSPAIQFKGSGWYITDYSQKGKSSESSSSSKSESESSASKSSDAKKDSSSTTTPSSTGSAKADS
jgi:putative FmdB family regulatory protein